MTVRRIQEHDMNIREVPRDDPALLFIHGLGESGLCFEDILTAPELRRYNLLVPDLPGYGLSPWPDDPLSLVDQADHLAAWLQGRGTGPVVLIGHSMGGIVALLLAERHPELVRAVVDVDGNKTPADCAFSSVAAEQDLTSFFLRGFDGLKARVHFKGEQHLDHRRYFASLRMAETCAFHLNSCELVEMSARQDLARRLAALPVPHLYIAGSPGGAAPESLRLLEEAGVPVATISPSGHWPFIDQPAAFLEVLAGFLATL